MEPLTAIYAILGGLSLVGADAYFSSSTIHLKTSVAPVYVEAGFTPDLVEALLLAEFEDVIDARSLVKTPHIMSSKDQPVSSALAQAAGLSDALEAAKSTVGVNHPNLIVNVVVDKKEGKETPRIVVAGDNGDGKNIGFSVAMNSEALDAALADVAFKSMLEINPYIATLHALENSEAADQPPLEAKRLIEGELSDATRDEFDTGRAQFENLMGLTQLLLRNPDEAGRWFVKAANSDNSFEAAILNKAFMAMLQGNYAAAAEMVKPVVEPSYYWGGTNDKFLLYASYNILGVCYSMQGQFSEANSNFELAAAERPNGASVYHYWSNSLRREGKLEQSKAMSALADKNIGFIDSYPEVAMLHFWFPENGSKELTRRIRGRPDVVADTVSPLQP